MTSPSPERAPSNARSEKHETREYQEQKEVPRLGGSFTSLEKEEPNRANQDAGYVNVEAGVAAVFDGVGGHKGGEVASSLGAEVLSSLVEQGRFKTTDEGQIKLELSRALQLAERTLAKRAQEHPELGRAGTTAVVAKVIDRPDGTRKAIIAHAGDSRASIYRKDGSHDFITLDHKVFSSKNDAQARKTQEQADLFPASEEPPNLIHYAVKDNIITQSISGKPDHKLRVSLNTVELSRGDILELCSDGIHENLSRQDRADIYRNAQSAEDASKKIAHAARAQSREKNWRAKRDDMTVAVLIDNRPLLDLNKIKMDTANLPFVTEDGSLEWGWKLAGQDVVQDKVSGKDIRVVRLQKPTKDGPPHTETLSVHELRSAIAINKAQTFSELRQALQFAHGLESKHTIEVPRQVSTRERLMGAVSGKSVAKTKMVRPKFNADTLIHIIDLIRSGGKIKGKPATLNYITNTAGLRKKVASLLEKERKSGQIGA